MAPAPMVYSRLRAKSISAVASTAMAKAVVGPGATCAATTIAIMRVATASAASGFNVFTSNIGGWQDLVPPIAPRGRDDEAALMFSCQRTFKQEGGCHPED